MRLFGTILAGGLLYGQAALASSFVTLTPPEPGQASSIIVLGKDTPSFVALGEPDEAPQQQASSRDYPAWAPPAASAALYPQRSDGTDDRPRIAHISASVIAMGEPAKFEPGEIAPDDIRVAALPKRPFDPTPMVIRGGIAGEAFISAAPAAPSQPSAPGAVSAPSVAAGGASGQQRREAPKREEMPQPAPPPPPPPQGPTRLPE